MSQRLGLDRDIKLAWLDAAAAIAARRLGTSDTQKALMAALEGEVPGTTPQSGRGKTVTVLRRVWYSVPAEATSLRDLALTLLQEGDARDRLALHWAMLLGTHPFFGDVAASVGRSLSLQGAFDRASILRRVKERWGDRSTLSRAIPRLLASFVDWGVLERDRERFTAPAARLALGTDHEVVLLEAAILASPGATSSVAALAASPMLFPFDIHTGLERVRRSDRFTVHREGMDTEIVALRR
jgi:hypothetical protein